MHRDPDSGHPLRGYSLDDPTPDVETEAEGQPRGGIGRNAVATLAFKVVGLPFTFAVTVVTSRYLLPTGRGAFVLALLTVTIAATILGNIGTAATHELARGESDARAVAAQALLVSVVLGAIGAVVLFPVDYALADQGFRRVSFVAVGLPGLLVVQSVTAMLVAVGRLMLANVLQLLLTIVTLGGMLAFVLGLHRGTTGAVLAWVAAQMAIAALGLVTARSLWWPVRLAALPFHRVRAMVLLGIKLGLVNLVGQLNYRIELILLELYHGLADVGLYSLATSLGELLWIVSGAVAAAAVAPVLAARDDVEAALVAARSVRWAVLGTVVGAVCVGVAGWFLIVPIFGPPFESSAKPLVLLLPGIVAFAPGVVTAVYFSQRQGRTRYPLQIAIVSLAVTSVLAVILIPGHFGVGAAAACSGGYVVGGILGLYWFVRQAHVPVRQLLPSFADVTAGGRVLRGFLPG